MNTIQSNKIDSYRRLAIKKDLIELSQWMEIIEDINTDLKHFKLIEFQLIQDNFIANNLLSFRRKNTLVMGLLCKYEQALKKEYEYGKQEYNLERAKKHEEYRAHYVNIHNEFKTLKKLIYTNLSKFKRR